MNPYEPTSHSTTELPNLCRQSRLPEATCVVATALANPLAAIAVIWRIDSIILPSMSFWMIIVMALAVVFALPLGLGTTLLGRIVNRLSWGLPLAVTILISSFPLTYIAVERLAYSRIESLLLQYASMLGVVALVPVALGIAIYCATAHSHHR